MTVQPKPSPADPTTALHGDSARPHRVPACGPRLSYTWPVEFEVEPWRP